MRYTEIFLFYSVNHFPKTALSTVIVLRVKSDLYLLLQMRKEGRF